MRDFRSRRTVAGLDDDSVQAIRIILAEHRSLAAVLHGLLDLVRNIRFHLAEPDFELLRATVHYVDASRTPSPPKEAQYLFQLVRRRHPDAASLLDRLDAEHRESEARLSMVAHALERYQHGGVDVSTERFNALFRRIVELAPPPSRHTSAALTCRRRVVEDPAMEVEQHPATPSGPATRANEQPGPVEYCA